MAMTQMNVRIDSQVRAEGTLALESVGITPARAIRGLWSFAARNRNNPERIKRKLEFLNDSHENDDSQTERAQLVQSGWKLMNDSLTKLGIDIEHAEAVSPEAMKERAYRERWESKGLL